MAHIQASDNTLAILRGELDVTDWSDEELQRGQRRDRKGTWGGRPPKVIPKAIHDELVKRKMSKAYDLLVDNVLSAVKILVEVATDRDADAGVRVKAAGMILDRGIGKAPVHIQVDAAEPLWARALRSALVEVPVDGIINTSATDDDEKPFE